MYIINAILIFLGGYGTINCLTSAFSITYDNKMLAIILFVIALIFAFMYSNEILKKVCYVILLVVMTTLIWGYRIIINSGFSRILNVILENVESVFVLPKIKRYTEVVKDKDLAVIFCLVFIGIMLEMLLNIVISEYMNYVVVAVITFPMAQMGMYFDLKPDMKYFMMLMICYLVVCVIRFNGNYSMVNKRVKSKKDIRLRTSKKKEYIECGKKSKNIVYMAITVIIFIVMVVGMIRVILPEDRFRVPKSFNTMKEKTNEPVRNFIIGGFSALFNKNSGSGGINGGQLGRVSSINFDYKTDLSIKMIPYTSERMYLRGYVGTFYEKDYWRPLVNRNDKDYAGSILNIDLSHKKELAESKRTMEITNIGANEKFVYCPYYSDYKNKIIKRMPIGEKNELVYYTTTKNFENKIFKLSEEEEIFKDDNDMESYTEISIENKKVIEKLCPKEKFTGDALEKAEKVSKFLGENYEYSLRPGMLPQNKDYVNYFLTENKKGYCAHFASSAVLILRNLGVKARYVEGYVIDYSDILEGETKGKEKIISIKDTNAHAWIEVYANDFGWVPVEMTPADYSEEDESATFVFKPIKGFKNAITNVTKCIPIIKILVIMGIIIWYLSIPIKRILRNKSFNTNDYRKNLHNLYQYMVEIIGYNGLKLSTGMKTSEYIEKLCQDGYFTENIANKIVRVIEKSEYSRNEVSEIEYKEVKSEILLGIKRTYKNMKFGKKIKLILIKKKM